jgi:hypothetical protein
VTDTLPDDIEQLKVLLQKQQAVRSSFAAMSVR